MNSKLGKITSDFLSITATFLQLGSIILLEKRYNIVFNKVKYKQQKQKVVYLFIKSSLAVLPDSIQPLYLTYIAQLYSI